MAPPPPDAFRFPTPKRHHAPAANPGLPDEQPTESALDHGVEGSFPASDPVSVTVSQVRPPARPLARIAAQRSADGAHPSRGRPALRSAAVARACASVLSIAVLMLAGWRETGSAVAPTNATSHWLWGREALVADRASWRHTAVGYLTHHLAATFWATLYAGWYGRRRNAPSVPVALAGATTACIADYTVTPPRLRPGVELRLSTPAMAAMYGALALGFAAGCLLADRR